MKDSFIFYKYYYDAIKKIANKDTKLKTYELIFKYVFENEDISKVDDISGAVIEAIKPNLDKNLKSYTNFINRNNSKYKNWRNEVLKRDKKTCQMCGSKKDIVVHHIKSFSEYPEFRYDIRNGITLCKVCHMEIHYK